MPYSDEEKRRDEILLRMLKTQPKPHSEMKLGKSRKKRSALLKTKRRAASSKP
jgi:hypothetical protein